MNIASSPQRAQSFDPPVVPSTPLAPSPNAPPQEKGVDSL